MGDSYSWIGASDGSWNSVSNWADVTSDTSPALSQPGTLNPVTIAGPTGSIYEVINSGGGAASVDLTGLADLSGSYTVAGALTTGTAITASNTTASSGSLWLGAGSSISAASVALNSGEITLTGYGAALSTGSLTMGQPEELITQSGSYYLASDGAFGTISVGAGATLTAALFDVVSGYLNLDGSAAVADIGSLTLGIAPSSGQPGYTSPYFYGSTGELAVSGGAMLTVSRAISAPYATMSITGSGSELRSEGILSFGGGGLGLGGPLAITSGGTLQVAGLLLEGGSTPFSNDLYVDTQSVAEVGTAGNAATGALTVDAGAGLTCTGTNTVTAPSIIDHGWIDAHGVTTLSANISGNGTLYLGYNATLVLDGTVASTDAIVFRGTAAALEIGTNGFSATSPLYPVAGTITGFAAGDSIIFDNTALTTASYTATGANTGALELLDGTSQVATLNLAGDYTGDAFLVSPNTSGGSDVSMLAATGGTPCFAKGTSIRTERGDVPVEELREDDLIPTMIRENEAPVVWIGRRTVDCARHPKPRKVWPVRVRAGAFGPGLPARDLWLSPDHAVFFESVLIPVKYLINGTAIAQVPVDRVTYYHLELPRHDVILAEGLATESFLDTGGKCMFENGGAPTVLHPDFSVLVWEAEGCAPLVVTGPEVVAARRRLAKAA